MPTNASRRMGEKNDDESDCVTLLAKRATSVSDQTTIGHRTPRMTAIEVSLLLFGVGRT
jgi:hypothetical protein